jgi:glycosyltransferase involved in cell wall biosynthesis
MKVGIVSASDGGGGAAIAAHRLHSALVRNGVDSVMRVRRKTTGDWRVVGPSGRWRMMQAAVAPVAEAIAAKVLRAGGTDYRSPGIFGSLPAGEIDNQHLDVVNLHWVSGGHLSVRQIGRIRTPTVWTLHDMWPFCGTEHYAPEDPHASWRRGPAAGKTGSPGFDRWVRRRKARHWRRQFPLVTPSRWLARCVRDSALLGGWPVHVIPYPLDTQSFVPHDKMLARNLLGLPPDATLVMFGAIGGSTDPRKGWDLLEPAIGRLGEDVKDFQIVIFGESEPRRPPRLGVPLNWLGELRDTVTLALAYSAADVMVIPSRQDNLPQCGLEAQACGCPVVAFDVGGLEDVLEHGGTGYLASADSSDALARAIRSVLATPERRARMSQEARARALRLWAPDIVTSQYMEVFNKAIEMRRVTPGGPV